LYRRQGSRQSPRKRNAKKAKWLSEESLQRTVKKEKQKAKEKKNIYIYHLNEESQRRARRDKTSSVINAKK